MDVETLAPFTTFLAGILVIVGLVLAMLPVGECDRCSHCRQERLARAKGVKVEACPFCRKMHGAGECARDRED